MRDSDIPTIATCTWEYQRQGRPQCKTLTYFGDQCDQPAVKNTCYCYYHNKKQQGVIDSWQKYPVGNYMA